MAASAPIRCAHCYPTIGECFPRARPAYGNTAFTSKDFGEFARNWDVHLQFRCADSPSENGIVERSHRTVKTIATRKNCSILEAVYWHNVTPKDDVSPCTAPADALHRYHVWIKGIKDNPSPEPEVIRGKYEKGDVVWVKNPRSKCTPNIALVALLKWSARSLWKLMRCLVTLRASDQ